MNETERINTFSIDDAIAQASKLFTSLFFIINIFSKKKKVRVQRSPITVDCLLTDSIASKQIFWLVRVLFG
ncbi:hypothetical protein HanRHA438_Chr11g0531841 [Helianthus annuus]|nr:hypothetical protein HanRHA438_Chr11g0531841 [Helianthus annuus]